MKLNEVKGNFIIAKRVPGSNLPVAPSASELFCLTVTPDEISILAEYSLLESEPVQSGPYSAFKIEGQLDFGLIGIVASLTKTLAEAEISVLTVSTYDTDYFLVTVENRSRAIEAWLAAGHEVLATHQ